MSSYELSDCAEILLDLICYEICRDKLSPETEALLANHLIECAVCREKVRNFKQLLAEKPTVRNVRLPILFSNS
jgi:hypothetical protein